MASVAMAITKQSSSSAPRLTSQAVAGPSRRASVRNDGRHCGTGGCWRRGLPQCAFVFTIQELADAALEALPAPHAQSESMCASAGKDADASLRAWGRHYRSEVPHPPCTSSSNVASQALLSCDQSRKQVQLGVGGLRSALFDVLLHRRDDSLLQSPPRAHHCSKYAGLASLR